LLTQGGTYDHWSYNSKAGVGSPTTGQIRIQLQNLQTYFDKLPLDSLSVTTPDPPNSWMTNISKYPGPAPDAQIWETSTAPGAIGPGSRLPIDRLAADSCSTSITAPRGAESRTIRAPSPSTRRRVAPMQRHRALLSSPWAATTPEIGTKLTNATATLSR